MKEVFTLRRFYFRLGSLCSLGFLAWLLATIVMMFSSDDLFPPNSDPVGKVLFGAFVLLVPSFLVGLSTWVLLAYSRESITLDGNAMRFTGVIVARSINAEEVTLALWRWGPHPSLKIYSRKGKATVWFENFRGDQQRRLILYFRDQLQPAVQQGWSDEVERYAAEIELNASAPMQETAIRETYWMIWRGAAFAVPWVALVCAVFVVLVACFADGEAIAECPSWSGSIYLDVAVYGALTVIGFPLVFIGAALCERWMLDD